MSFKRSARHWAVGSVICGSSGPGVKKSSQHGRMCTAPLPDRWNGARRIVASMPWRWSRSVLGSRCRNCWRVSKKDRRRNQYPRLMRRLGVTGRVQIAMNPIIRESFASWRRWNGAFTAWRRSWRLQWSRRRSCRVLESGAGAGEDRDKALLRTRGCRGQQSRLRHVASPPRGAFRAESTVDVGERVAGRDRKSAASCDFSEDAPCGGALPSRRRRAHRARGPNRAIVRRKVTACAGGAPGSHGFVSARAGAGASRCRERVSPWRGAAGHRAMTRRKTPGSRFRASRLVWEARPRRRCRGSRSESAPASPLRDCAAEGDGIDCRAGSRRRVLRSAVAVSVRRGPGRRSLPAPRARSPGRRAGPIARSRGGRRRSRDSAVADSREKPAASPDVAGHELTAAPRGPIARPRGGTRRNRPPRRSARPRAAACSRGFGSARPRPRGRLPAPRARLTSASRRAPGPRPRCCGARADSAPMPVPKTEEYGTDNRSTNWSIWYKVHF